MNAVLFGRAAHQRLSEDQPVDAAWMVMEAANDLGDVATVDACRRVIDANLNGTPVSQSDLHIVLDYFR